MITPDGGAIDDCVTVLMPASEEARLLAALTEQAGMRRIESVISKVDSAQATAWLPADKERIFAAIERTLPGGFTEMNQVLRRWLANWAHRKGTAALADCSLTAQRSDTQHLTQGLDGMKQRLLEQAATDQAVREQREQAGRLLA